MDFQEANEWSKSQTIVKVRAFRENEEDKFIFMVGEYVVSPLVFDSQEEAEQYLEDNFKLTNLDLTIIGCMCQKLNKLSEEQLNKNKEK